MHNLSELRSLLFRMEVEVGLSELSDAERNMLYAIMAANPSADGFIRNEAIRSSPLARHLSDPTFQRALRSLVEKGYVKHAPGYRRGAYVLI